MIAALLALALAQAPLAGADGGVPTSPPSPPVPEVAQEPEPAPPSVEERLDALEQELHTTQAKLKSLQVKQDWTSKVSLGFSGYFDFGFFTVEGDGSGVRQDLRQDVTKYKGQLLSPWVLVGDPLSTTINSRGDVADTGASRAIRFDPVKSGGRPTFIVNAVNLAMLGSAGHDLTFVASIDFLIRDRNVSNPQATIGDYFDLKLAYARYQLASTGATSTSTRGRSSRCWGWSTGRKTPTPGSRSPRR